MYNVEDVRLDLENEEDRAKWRQRTRMADQHSPER